MFLMLTNFGSGSSNSDQIFDNQKDVLLTAKQLAAKLSCSVSYIKKLRAQGVIQPAVKVGRYVRYKYDCVVASLKRKGENT